MMGTKVNDKKHLQIVKNIEIKKVKSPIGIQDYLPGIYGGFKEYVLNKKGVKIKKISKINTKKFLNIVIYYGQVPSEVHLKF